MAPTTLTRERAGATATSPEPIAAERAPARPIFLHALRSALGRTPLWVTTAAVTSAMALVLSLAWFDWYSRALHHHYEPGSLLRSLDETFLFDHRVERGALEEGTRATGAVLAFVAMLFGVFFAGGWLQVFLERTEGHSLRRFFFGGSRYFFRFLRVLLLTLLTLHFVGYLLYGTPWEFLVERLLLGIKSGDLQELESELVARRVGFVQDGAFAAMCALVLAWGDYTRTRLAMHDTSSSVWAGLCSWVLILRHPWRTLRPLAFLWTLEIAALWLAWLASDALQASLGPGSGIATVIVLVLVGQLLLMWRAIVRGARYGAALSVSQQIVRPLARPDPWKQSLGGPGGPRYPIGGDEFEV